MKRALKKSVCLLLALVLLAPVIGVSAAAPVSITAPSAIVIDFDSGEILFAKDIDTMRVPASMTKIMTAYIVFEEIEKGNLTKETLMTVSPRAASLSRNSSYPAMVPLQSGASYTVHQLMQLIMVPSASASCVVIAEHISGTEEAFVERMNETAARMGVQAEYKNSHGAQPHYITARGVATLIRAFCQDYPDILEYTSLTSINFNGATYSNTNRLLPGGLDYYPGTDGFKTGTIPEAGFCLSASVLRDGRRIIAVVLGASNRDTRNTDAIAILNYGFAELTRREEARAATTLTFTNPKEIRLGADFDVLIHVSDVGTVYQVDGAAFTVDGVVTKTEAATTITNGQVFRFTHYIPQRRSQPVNIGFYLTMPNGTKKEVSVNIPVSGLPPALYRDTNDHWAQGAIEELIEHGVFSVDSSGYFRPAETMNRGMFIYSIYRLAGCIGVDTNTEEPSPFIDVLPGDFCYEAVAWAYSEGIVEGFNSAFDPNGFITREQAAAKLYRFLGIPEPSGDQVYGGPNIFTDAEDISDWALDAIMRMSQAGLITGYDDGSFGPKASLSRADAATLMQRTLRYTYN